MGSEAIEVQLARMDEHMKMILSDLDEAKKLRKDQYEYNADIKIELERVNSRLSNLERSIAESEPTLKEFVKYKSEVIGAGKLGKWIWAGAGALIGAIAASRGFILHLLGLGPN